jgi:hypothetical protein
MNKNYIFKSISTITLFITTCFCGIPNCAQNKSEPISTHYVLPAFEKGIVRMKNGQIEEVKIDYNMLSEEMIFENGGTRLAMDKIETIDTVYLGSRKFVPYEKYFLEILLEDQVSLFIRHKLNILQSGSPAGYGGTTETGAAHSISYLVGSGSLYKLQLPSEYHLTDASQFWIKKESSFFRIGTERQILDIFPEKSKEIKQFIRQNKINLRKEKDVITLINRCNELLL